MLRLRGMGAIVGLVVVGCLELGCSGNTVEGSACNTSKLTVLRGFVPGANGSVLRQYWLALPEGDQFTKILRETLTDTPPDGSDTLSRLQTDGFGTADTATTQYGSDFGERIFGFIKAPATGAYQFLVSGDNQVAFFLSVDDKHDSIVQKLEFCRGLGDQDPCASSTQGGPAVGAETLSPEYTRQDSFSQPSQISVSVILQAGKFYFFDWYHRESKGDTHALVKWAKPGQTATAANAATLEIVPGSALYSADSATPGITGSSTGGTSTGGKVGPTGGMASNTRGSGGASGLAVGAPSSLVPRGTSCP